MKEIRVHGRGGMGAVTSAQVLAIAAFKDGKMSQAFPFFGVARRGSPVEAYCRIDEKFIRVRQQVYKPDYVLILDKTLLGAVDVLKGLKPEGTVIINSAEKPDLKTEAKVYHVDATKIAIDIFGRNLVNTPILGAFVKATGEVSLDSITKTIQEKFPKEIADKNIEAIKRAYDGCSE
ncbi:MAG: pyruvate ferredoxin oxidoreductase subunit gamma [Candidatus Aenigmarchaeota archaeon]|nr:pyruvate ferredoxin oxidoreductase subunit gamma [Candidatus Aenigmarchaeota archaeon]